VVDGVVVSSACLCLPRGHGFGHGHGNIVCGLVYNL